jgi:hypothetical protein
MPSEKIKSLQVMRFVAAAMVVAVHAIYFVSQLPPGPALPSAHIDIGASGVDIFFVISGFVIYRSALKRPPALSFLRKRFLRIARFTISRASRCFPYALFQAGRCRMARASRLRSSSGRHGSISPRRSILSAGRCASRCCSTLR